MESEVNATTINSLAKSLEPTAEYVGEPPTRGGDSGLTFLDLDQLQWTRRRIPIASLVHGGSPRSSGEDEAHVQRLMEADMPLPPILVHGATMQIIDGFHRVGAAIRSGANEIDALLLDLSIESAFIVAVRANVTHGLPLSLSDRRAAVGKVLHLYPQWSDRAIASATGLSASTVSSIRRATADNGQLHKRRGKDGRIRPLNAATGRQLASKLLEQQPNASLREIANAAGISTGTVRDVRDRLRRGVDPVPARDRNVAGDSPRRGKAPALPQAAGAATPADVGPLIEQLSRDPSLRMSIRGRWLLRWLRAHAINQVDNANVVASVPAHSHELLIVLASRCSANWAKLAQDLAANSERQENPGDDVVSEACER